MLPYLTLGPWRLATYESAHVAGVLIGVLIGLHALGRLGVPWWRALGALAMLVVAAHVGARLHFLWLTRDRPRLVAPSSLAAAGLSLQGGIVAAGLAGLALSRLLRVSPWRLADALAGPAALALGVFRLGCWGRGCCFGRRCDPDGWMAGLSTKLIRNVETSLHPTQLYEATAALAAGLLLVALTRRPRRVDGELGLGLLAGYGLWRFCIQFLRADHVLREPAVTFGAIALDRSQLLAAALASLALVTWLVRRRRADPRHRERSPGQRDD